MSIAQTWDAIDPETDTWLWPWMTTAERAAAITELRAMDAQLDAQLEATISEFDAMLARSRRRRRWWRP